MSQLCLITTIMPTYQRPKLLRRAIRSVLNQTYPHFKLCIYDNASGDETAFIVESFMKKDSRIQYHCHPDNIGAANNFLYGLDRVNTPFFNFLSDDDIILPHFFEKAINALHNIPEAAYFVGATIRADSAGRFMEVPVASWKNGIYHPPDGFIEMLRNGRPEWTAILFRSNLICRNRLNFDSAMLSDLDFQLQTAARYPIMVNTTPCAIFFLHPIVKTPRSKLSVEIPGMFKIIEKIYKIEELPENIKYEARCRIMKLMQRTAFRFGIRGALTGFWDDTEYAHKILSIHFQNQFQAKLLRLILSESISSHFLLVLMKLIWGIRRFLRKNISTKWEFTYRNYKKYLNEISYERVV